MLKISLSKVYELVKSGQLVAVKLGTRTLRITDESLQELLRTGV